jgi:hypothetical protein
MSESPEVLASIHQKLRGRILLIGRKIGQSRLDVLGASLKAEAKPHKYPTGGGVLAWEKGLLARFGEGEFESIILHRFLYKPVKDYLEEPAQILSEVRRILPKGGVLVINSYLLNETTKDYRAAETFYTEQEMMDIIERQHFRNVSRVGAADALLFVCEN